MNPTIANEGPRPPSITAPLIQKNKETDFLTAATAAIDRGFAVTPVSPFKKCGVLSRWQVHPGKTQSEINQYAKDYPHYNVGVVSRRGVGNLMFLDIDSEGVLEQIEAETGHQLPLTYSVQSRPQSAPWKRHLYFKQTRYSYDAFGRDKSREINVKDLSAKPDVRGIYPNRYDVKGIGGGGLVVAAGSVRDTGEVYEGNDAPTVTVPDWLVDWVVEDRRKYRSGTAKIREAVKTKQLEGMQAKATKESLPEYTKDEINIALWSRACSFASLGTRRQTIKRLLKEQVEDFMKDGEAFVAEWADRIHEIAFDPELRIGKLRREFLPKNRPQDRPKTYIKPTEPVTVRSDGSITVWPTIHRHDLWEKAIEGFPNDLSASEVRTRLRKALQKHPGIPFSERGAQRAMEKAGFSSRNVGGTYVWSRKPGREQEQGEQYRDHPIHRTIAWRDAMKTKTLLLRYPFAAGLVFELTHTAWWRIAVLTVLCVWFCESSAHAQNAFPGDQDTIHLYPFVCAADGSNAKDTIGTSDLQNQGGVTYPPVSGAGFCNARSVSGTSRLITNTDVTGNFGTLVFTTTFLDHAGTGGPPSFIDWGNLVLGYHVLMYRDATNHVCIYMADYPVGTCSNSTYSDNLKYHFAVTYDDGQNAVKLYDSANGLLFTRPFGHISNASFTGLAMGGFNSDGNAGPSTLLSQVFIENRPWTDQEVQNYFSNFTGFLTFPLRNQGPYNTDISAVFDHDVKPDNVTQMPVFYSPNTMVKTYTGEEGVQKCGHPPCPNSLFKGSPSKLLGYKNTSDTAFLQVLNGHYTGGSCDNPPCSHFLFYTGHAGFDYPQPLGTEIIAPADGLLFIPTNTRTASNSTFGEPVDKFAVMALDHGNGYASWFLHAGCTTGTKDSHCALNGGDFRGIDGNGTVICANLTTTGCPVKRGDVIGLVGNKGLGTDPSVAHLHFEVRKGLAQNPGGLPICVDKCLPVDPYGWTRTSPEDPYSQFLGGVNNLNLWK